MMGGSPEQRQALAAEQAPRLIDRAGRKEGARAAGEVREAGLGAPAPCARKLVPPDPKTIVANRGLTVNEKASGMDPDAFAACAVAVKRP
jgi:hypothetical protein